MVGMCYIIIRKRQEGNQMTKLEIVKELVSNGYHLMGRTEEEMANMFDEETLKNFLENFKKYLDK